MSSANLRNKNETRSFVEILYIVISSNHHYHTDGDDDDDDDDVFPGTSVATLCFCMISGCWYMFVYSVFWL